MSIAFSVLSIDEGTKILDIFWKNENLKTRKKKIPGSRRNETMDAETSRRRMSGKKILEMKRVTEEFHYI